MGTPSGYGFVNTVVYDFEDEMMKPPLVGTSDVHTRAATNCLKSFQDLNIMGSIVIYSVRGVLFQGIYIISHP